MELFLRYGACFPVPVAVADHLLKLASHDQLKVLLYVLAHANEPISTEQVTRACQVSADTVEEALVFWENVNVIGTAQDTPRITVADRTVAAPAPVSVPEVAPQPETQPAALPVSSAGFSLMPSEIAKRIENDAALSEMFEHAQKIAGVLNNTMQKSLIWMHEYLGLSPDILLMLIAFCHEHDKFQVRYLETVALEWQERGILTHELADADIQRRIQNMSFTGTIKKLFQMQRDPTPKQQAYADGWLQLGVPLELLECAYEKAIENTGGKLQFKYIDTTVRRWMEQGIRTRAEAEQESEEFHAKKQSGTPKKHANRPPDENTSFSLDDFDQLVNRF